MNVNILESVKFVVLPDGRQVAQLEMEAWEELLEILEDIEDAEDIARIKKAIAAGEEELIPWEQVEAEYLATHPENDV